MSGHLAVGHGGAWVCRAGHEGFTPAAMGVPDRCLVGYCDELVDRVGEGSRRANEVMTREREAG